MELKKRRLGRTNMMVTELGLGAMDTPTVKEGAETLQLALDLGVNFIDTAREYQGSEYLLGQVIGARGGRTSTSERRHSAVPGTVASMKWIEA